MTGPNAPRVPSRPGGFSRAVPRTPHYVKARRTNSPSCWDRSSDSPSSRDSPIERQLHMPEQDKPVRETDELLSEAISQATADLGIDADSPVEFADEQPGEPEEDTEDESTPKEPEPPAADETEEQPSEDSTDEDDADSEPETDDTKIEVDGEELTLQELKDGYRREADYTRKTQELAKKREQVEQREQEASDLVDQVTEFWNERMDNPAAWTREIADEAGGDQVLAEAIAASKDPNQAFGQVVRHLVQTQALSDNVVEQLGLAEMADQAEDDHLRSEVDSLKQELEKERNQREEEKRQQQEAQEALQHYQQEFSDLERDVGLEFDSPQQRHDAFVGLLKKADEMGVSNLRQAYEILAFRRSQHQQPAPNQPQQDSDEDAEQSAEEEAAAAVDEHKKKTSAMSSNPSGGSTGTKKLQSDPSDTRAVIEETMAELGW